MVLDERARHELFLRLEQALGPESAETLMEMLPPVGWADVATKRDLDALEERMNLRFERRSIGGSRRWSTSFCCLPRRAAGAVRPVQRHHAPRRGRCVIANIGTVLSMAALAFGAAKLT